MTSSLERPQEGTGSTAPTSTDPALQNGETEISLSSLDQKLQRGEPATRDDLIFLYGIETPIKEFDAEGNRDPLVASLLYRLRPRYGEKLENHLRVIFECEKEQIARMPSEVGPDTKVYIGQLEPGVFEKLPESVEYIYTSFPDRRVWREQFQVGGKSVEQLANEVESSYEHISSQTKGYFTQEAFAPAASAESAKFVRLTIADLGFTIPATTGQVYKRAETLGLELCPPDTGPQYFLQRPSLRENSMVRIAMEPIVGDPSTFSHAPSIFEVANVKALSLTTTPSDPGTWLDPKEEFMFRIAKSQEIS